jgi:hypothetical protein
MQDQIDDILDIVGEYTTINHPGTISSSNIVAFTETMGCCTLAFFRCLYACSFKTSCLSVHINGHGCLVHMFTDAKDLARCLLGIAECKDAVPPFDSYDVGCYWILQQGKCNDKVVRNPQNPTPEIKMAGGYCGATCNSCPQSEPTCSNLSPDKLLCAQHRAQGRCAQRGFASENFCQVMSTQILFLPKRIGQANASNKRTALLVV